MAARTSRISIRGIATDVQWYPKDEHSAFHVLTFNVEEVDNFGNHVRLVPVTFKLTNYTNVVNNGDEVIIIGILEREKILLAETVFNHKTNSLVNSYDFGRSFFWADLWANQRSCFAILLLIPISMLIGALYEVFFGGSIQTIVDGLAGGFVVGVLSIPLTMITAVGVKGLRSLIRGRG